MHVTLVNWPASESASHAFCDSCYSSSDAARVTLYQPRPDSPLPDNVESITAREYLEACDKAGRNGFDRPALKHIHAELKRLPATHQRLAFELLNLARASLEQENDPIREAGFAGCSWRVIEAQRVPEYVAGVEKIIFRSFDLRSQLSTPPGDYGPFALTLQVMLTAFGHIDRGRFASLLQMLKARGGNPGLDPRWNVIARAENSMMN